MQLLSPAGVVNGIPEYCAHDPDGSLIATIQQRATDEFLICWYGGKNHGKLTVEVTMNNVISMLAERLAEDFHHSGSVKDFDSDESFEYFRWPDGRIFKLCVFGQSIGNYVPCH